MAKSKTVYVCTECGYESIKYWGKCPDCGNWNTLKEISKRELDMVNRSFSSGPSPEVRNLSEISVTDEDRFTSGIEELDRVLGGGTITGN